MSADEIMLMRREVHAARRLARLFRIERSGRLERWPRDTTRRFTERRGRLIDELARCEAERRSLAAGTPAELDLAMGELAREVGRAEQGCRSLVVQLEAELGRLRGEAGATGLRDRAGGQILGRG